MVLGNMGHDPAGCDAFRAPCRPGLCHVGTVLFFPPWEGGKPKRAWTFDSPPFVTDVFAAINTENLLGPQSSGSLSRIAMGVFSDWF